MKGWAVLGLLALTLASCDVFAQGALRGPYLNNVTSDAVTVIWETPSASTGIVRYGALSTAEHTVASSAPSTHHEVRLTGLSAFAAPGSEIRYEVEIGGVRHESTFRTAPTGNAPVSFIVYGDNRSSPQQHQVVIDALMAEPNIGFAINTGDLVANGEDEDDWDEFFPVAAPFLARTPLFVAIGNHEVDFGRWDVTRRLFDLPTGNIPASNDEGYYHATYGNVQLIVVNVEVDSLYTIGLLSGDQEAWLEDVLDQRPPGVEHRFLFVHQGPYSSKPGRNGNFWLRQWLDRLKMAGVDVIFSGHDHYAERGFAKNGMYYVIHGGGGAPLYNTLGPRTTSDHTIIFGETQLGYARVDVDGSKATVSIKSIGGQIVDQFTYGDTASPECVQPSDCGTPPTYACAGGGWTCERNACQWSCSGGSSSLFTCATDNACERQLGASCTGTPSCERPSVNPLTWYCQCIQPPDCTMDADCAARPSPLPGCSGTWACVREQCEFSSDLCEPLDGGAGDAGQAPDAGQADASAPDADPSDGAIDAGSAAPDRAPPEAADATPTTDAAVLQQEKADAGVAPIAAVPDESSCGCSSSPRKGSSAFVFFALLALIVSRRGLCSERCGRSD